MQGILSIHRRISVIFFLGIFLSMTSCIPKEDPLRGTWYFSENVGPGFSSFLEWEFKDGRFNVNGYPPLEQSGNYEIMYTKGDSIMVRLTNQQGDWPTEDKEILVIRNKSMGTLMINNRGPYIRQQESTDN